MIRARLGGLVLGGWLAAAQATVQGQVLQAADFSGALRLDYYSASTTLDDRHDLWGLTTQLRHERRWSEQWSSRVDLRTLTDVNRNLGTSGRTIEAYVRSHDEHWRVTAGKQIIAWGKADALNPTDNLSPRDYTVRLPFDEDQRLGTVGARLEIFADEQTTVSLYGSPFFSGHRLPLTPAIAAQVRKPEDGRWTVAAKIDRRGAAFDASLSLVHGFSLLPEWQVLASGAAGLRYPRMHVLGADAAWNVERWAWRAEVARFVRAEENRSGIGMPSHWSAVVGADRDFAADWNLNLQAVAKWGPAIEAADALLAPIAQANALTFVRQRRRMLGYTARLKRSWSHQTWNGELALVGYIGPHPGTSVRTCVTYVASDSLHITLGGNGYVGDVHSQFGMLKPTRGVFAELKYGF